MSGITIRQTAASTLSYWIMRCLMVSLSASSLVAKEPVSLESSFGTVSREGNTISSSGKESGAEFAAGKSTGRIFGDSKVTIDGGKADLQTGLLLMHSPKKSGLFSSSKSKAVMGNGEKEYTAECKGTMVVSYIPDEVMKVICTEGTVVVRLGGLLNAEFVELKTGQALVVNPAKAKTLPRAVDVDLTELNATSALMSDQFGTLSRQEDVKVAASKQQAEIRSGKLSPTPLLMNGSSPKVFLVRERGVEGTARKVTPREVKWKEYEAPEKVRKLSEVFAEPENVIESGRVFAADEQGSFLDIDDNGMRNPQGLSSGRDIEDVAGASERTRESTGGLSRFLFGDDKTTSQLYLRGSKNENGESIPIKLDAVEVSLTDLSSWPSYLNKPAVVGHGGGASDSVLLSAYFANPEAPTESELRNFAQALATANKSLPVRLAFVPASGHEPVAWWNGRALVDNEPVSFASAGAEFDVKGNVWIGGTGGFSRRLQGENPTNVDFGDRRIVVRTALGNRAGLNEEGQLASVDGQSTYTSILGAGRYDSQGSAIQWGIRRIIEENRNSKEAFGNAEATLDGYGIYDILADAMIQMDGEAGARGMALSSENGLLDYDGVQAEGGVAVSREVLAAVAVAQNLILVNRPDGITGTTVFDIERLVDPETDELAEAFLQRLREIQGKNVSSPRFLATGGSLLKEDYETGVAFLRTRDELANAVASPTLTLTVQNELNSLRALIGAAATDSPGSMSQEDQIKVLGALREVRNTARNETDVVGILNDQRFQISTGESLSEALFDGLTSALGNAATFAAAIEDAEANVINFLKKAANPQLGAVTPKEQSAYDSYRKYLVDVAAAVLQGSDDAQTSLAFDLHKHFIEENIFNQFIEIAKGDIRIEGSAHAPTEVAGGSLEFSAAESVVVTGADSADGSGLTGIRSNNGTLVIISNNELTLDADGNVSQESIATLEASLAKTPFANFRVKLDADGKPSEDAQGNPIPNALRNSPLLQDANGNPVIDEQGFATFAHEVDPSFDPRWQIGDVKIANAQLQATGSITVDARGLPRDTVLPFLVDFAGILRAPQVVAESAQRGRSIDRDTERSGDNVSNAPESVLDELYGYFSYSDAETASIESVRTLAQQIDSSDGASLELSGEVTFVSPATVNLMARDGSGLTLNSIQVSPGSKLVFADDLAQGKVQARLAGDAIFVGLDDVLTSVESSGDLTIDSELIAVQSSKLNAGETLAVRSAGTNPGSADGLLYLRKSDLNATDVNLVAEASNMLVRGGSVEASGDFSARTLDTVRELVENPTEDDQLIRRVLFWAGAPITADTIRFAGGGGGEAALDPVFGDYTGDVVISETAFNATNIHLGANDFLVLAGNASDDDEAALEDTIRRQSPMTATETVQLVGGRLESSSFDGFSDTGDEVEFGKVYVSDYQIEAPIVSIESADDVELYNTTISASHIVISADAATDGYGWAFLEDTALLATQLFDDPNLAPLISVTSYDTVLDGAYISNPNGEVIFASNNDFFVDDTVDSFIEGNDVLVSAVNVDLFGLQEAPFEISAGNSVRIESDVFFGDFVEIRAAGTVSIGATGINEEEDGYALDLTDSKITSTEGSVELKSGGDLLLLGEFDSSQISALAGSIDLIAGGDLELIGEDANRVILAAKDIWLSAGDEASGREGTMVLQNTVMNADTIRALSYRMDGGEALIVDSSTMNANQLIQLYAGGVSTLRFSGRNVLDAGQVDLAGRVVEVDPGGIVVNQRAGGTITVYSDIRNYNVEDYGTIRNESSPIVEKNFSDFSKPSR